MSVEQSIIRTISSLASRFKSSGIYKVNITVTWPGSVTILRNHWTDHPNVLYRELKKIESIQSVAIDFVR